MFFVCFVLFCFVFSTPSTHQTSIVVALNYMFYHLELWPNYKLFLTLIYCRHTFIESHCQPKRKFPCGTTTLHEIPPPGQRNREPQRLTCSLPLLPPAAVSFCRAEERQYCRCMYLRRRHTVDARRPT